MKFWGRATRKEGQDLEKGDLVRWTGFARYQGCWVLVMVIMVFSCGVGSICEGGLIGQI